MKRQAAAAIDAAVKRFGRLDVAVLNAWICGELKPLIDYSVETFDKVVAVNVRGTWLRLKHALRAMKHSGGTIVITASTFSRGATPTWSPTSPPSMPWSDSCVRRRSEGAADGIRVNTVIPLQWTRG
jgi:NAD(P)-dependent dehydrogenase (short-subunit alcohol dehydrogenase family)